MDTIQPEDQAEWDEFNAWMSTDGGKDCQYIWLTWKDGTFTLDPADAHAKAMERFRLWQGHKRGIAQARANLKLVVDNKPKPNKKIDLKDLII